MPLDQAADCWITRQYIQSNGHMRALFIRTLIYEISRGCNLLLYAHGRIVLDLSSIGSAINS